MYKEPWDWKYIGLYVERAHQLPSPFRLPGHWQFLDILETALETSSLFCTPEHSSHDWSSLFQLTPKQCGGRPHVIPNQLNTAPALCTLHPHSVGDAFLCGGAEEWNFSCIEHEIKKEEARTSDNTLCEAAVSDLELTLLSLTATICSSSSPSASPHHCSTLSWLFFFSFFFLASLLYASPTSPQGRVFQDSFQCLLVVVVEVDFSKAPPSIQTPSTVPGNVGTPAVLPQPLSSSWS